jgi:hypothetical protein
MASIIEDGTTQQGKKVTGKRQVLESLGEFEMALCECIHSAQPEDLSDPGRLGERFASLKRCMEEMRTGVLLLQGVVQQQWPEQ